MTPRWKKPKAQVAHADDWLMTYADLITLLLCFFVILIITSVPKKNTQPKAPVATVQENLPVMPPAPIQVPTGTMHDVLAGDLPFYDEDRDGDEGDVPAPDAAKNTPAAPIAAAVEVKPEAAAPAPVESAPPVTLAEITADLNAEVQAELEKKGDRLTTLDMNSAAFFGSGSAALSSDGKAILQKLAVNLNSNEYRDYNITVEGHTDDTPIHTAIFPSNWELSTARASAVVQFFLGQGIPASRLRAAGYADTFPKVPNRDISGNPIPANRAENRRVVIKLEKIEKN